VPLLLPKHDPSVTLVIVYCIVTAGETVLVQRSGRQAIRS